VCFTDASEGNLFISKILNIDYLKKKVYPMIESND